MDLLRQDIRNVAIIAHVDHGKTTLVDGMLRQSGVFRANEQLTERVMDSNDLEKERGITILSKNTSVIYNGVKINIVDTPGHADFGGEVERILKMVDGVVLLVDAFEGTMPQTKFVLRKALELGLKPIVVINKIDRDGSRPKEVYDQVIELFIDLEADDDQLEFPLIYASSRDGYAIVELDHDKDNLIPLFEAIIENVPAPPGDVDGPLQLLVSSLDYDDYVGRIAVGRIGRGTIKAGQQVAVCKKDGSVQVGKISRLYSYEGLKRVEYKESSAGDIVALAGLPDVYISETVCAVDQPDPLPYMDIDEPTVTMTFCVNDSPFAGLESEYQTSRHLRERLYKEMETNVSLKIEDTETTEAFKVSGRGELHLSILIETMRRQGYEFQVSKPMVIFKDSKEGLMEPFEHLTIDVPETFTGSVMEKLGIRKGELLEMSTAHQGYTRLVYKVPTRGLIGYGSEFLTDTKGNGIMNYVFEGYELYKGEMPGRQRGSMIAWENGESITYGLVNAQERGRLFINPGIKVYAGMIVGENARGEDIVINVCKKKQMTNMRASGSEDAVKLIPPVIMSLEKCLEFISDDELIEVTPKNIRLRKKVLDNNLRSKKVKLKA